MAIENKEGQNSLQQVDMIWDGWLNSFKTIQGFQNEIADKSLQAFENQKDLLNTTRGTLSKMEEEANKISEEWKANLQNTVNTVDKDQFGPIVSTWMNQIEEINSTVQSLSWTPSKVMLDLFSQSQDQLESNVKNALDQQLAGSSEVYKTIEKLTEQMRDTHKKLLASV